MHEMKEEKNKMSENLQNTQDEEGTNEEKELLSQLVKNSEKQLFYARIRTLASLVVAAAVVACLVIVVPVVLRTVAQANGIMAQASETIALADTAIESITDMSQSITDMGENMDTFITENAQSVAQVMANIEKVDFEGLNSAIKDLGDVIEPLAKFFNRF